MAWFYIISATMMMLMIMKLANIYVTFPLLLSHTALVKIYMEVLDSP